jgi:hypothetical protein
VLTLGAAQCNYEAKSQRVRHCYGIVKWRNLKLDIVDCSCALHYIEFVSKIVPHLAIVILLQLAAVLIEFDYKFAMFESSCSIKKGCDIMNAHSAM